MKPVKEPLGWKECEKCHRPYSFFRFRVTLQNPKRDWCAACGIEEEKALSQRKQKTSEEV